MDFLNHQENVDPGPRPRLLTCCEAPGACRVGQKAPEPWAQGSIVFRSTLKAQSILDFREATFLNHDHSGARPGTPEIPRWFRGQRVHLSNFHGMPG